MNASMQYPPVPDENRGSGFLACSTIITVAALITVTLRFYVRARIVHAVGWDDWIILLAMSFSIILLAVSAKQISLGYGRHIYYVEQHIVEQIKFDTLNVVFVAIASCLSKVSICIFILRLLGNAAGKKGKRFLYILMLVLSVANIVDVTSLLIQCSPMAKIWNKKLAGTCWSPFVQEGFAYMQGAVSIFAAFALSAFPVLIFRSLQLNLRTKLALCLLMGLGAFDGACSVVRVALIPGFNASTDYPYTSIPIAYWANLEVNISIIAACIPPIRPLFRFFDRTHYRSPRHGSRQGYSEQKRPKRRTSLFATHMGTTDEEFGLSVFVSAGLDRDPVDDTSSQKSMLPSQVPPAITKTTQIDISN